MQKTRQPKASGPGTPPGALHSLGPRGGKEPQRAATCANLAQRDSGY